MSLEEVIDHHAAARAVGEGTDVWWCEEHESVNLGGDDWCEHAAHLASASSVWPPEHCFMTQQRIIDWPWDTGEKS